MKLTDLLQKVFYVLGLFKWKMRPIKDMTQARNQGGCTGCVRTPPQAPKVRILILIIQVKECCRLNWSLKLNNDV